MALKTPQQYLESLRDGRVVYCEGERVEDVTKDPLLSIGVNRSAWDYVMPQMPEYHDTFVAHDETGEEVSFVFLPSKSVEDLFRRREIIQLQARMLAGPGGVKFVGIDTLNSTTVNSRIVDQATGSHYTANVEEYRKFLFKNDPGIVGAMTDAKGDRSLRPGKQVQHKDFYVHIVDETKEHGQDGIVVRGAKMHISGAPWANEAIVMPCRAMLEEDKDYAVVFATPLNAKGITMIASAEEPRELDNDFDYPKSSTHFSGSCAIIFEDVFVPMERVFLKREWQYSANFTYVFANFHRLSADAYKYPELEIFVGLGALLAEYNGIDRVSRIRDNLAWLMMYAETVEALGKAACQFCVTQPGTDLVYPNPVYSNAAKFMFAENWHQATKIVQDIAGGLPCDVFSRNDYFNPETRPLIDKYFAGKDGVATEHRLRAMHLVQDLTGDYHDIVTIHAEGSLAAQRLSIYMLGDWERYKAAAKRVARIEDGTSHPVFSKFPKYPPSWK